MADFLKKCIHERNLIIKNKVAYSEIELNKLYEEYDGIFKEWKKEWMNSSIDENPVYDDERKLLARFEAKKKEMKFYIFLRIF